MRLSKNGSKVSLERQRSNFSGLWLRPISSTVRGTTLWYGRASVMRRTLVTRGREGIARGHRMTAERWCPDQLQRGVKTSAPRTSDHWRVVEPPRKDSVSSRHATRVSWGEFDTGSVRRGEVLVPLDVSGEGIARGGRWTDVRYCFVERIEGHYPRVSTGITVIPKAARLGYVRARRHSELA